jgi:hypothetical protein
MYRPNPIIRIGDIAIKDDLLYEEELEQIIESTIEITSVEQKLDELIYDAIANAAKDLIITNAIIEKREIEIISKIIKSKIK